MKKWITEGLKGLVAIVVTVIVTKWLSGEPLTGLTKLTELGHVLVRAVVPAWAFAVALFVALISLYELGRRFLKERRPKGKVHFVSDAHNSGWSGSEAKTDFRASGTFTYDGPGEIVVTKAFLKGTSPTTDMLVQVFTSDGLGNPIRVSTLDLRARQPTKALLVLWLTPIKATAGKPLNRPLILHDVYNRDFTISGVKWPYIGQRK